MGRVYDLTDTGGVLRRFNAEQYENMVSIVETVSLVGAQNAVLKTGLTIPAGYLLASGWAQIVTPEGNVCTVDIGTFIDDEYGEPEEVDADFLFDNLNVNAAAGTLTQTTATASGAVLFEDSVWIGITLNSEGTGTAVVKLFFVLVDTNEITYDPAAVTPVRINALRYGKCVVPPSITIDFSTVDEGSGIVVDDIVKLISIPQGVLVLGCIVTVLEKEGATCTAKLGIRSWDEVTNSATLFHAAHDLNTGTEPVVTVYYSGSTEWYTTKPSYLALQANHTTDDAIVKFQIIAVSIDEV